MRGFFSYDDDWLCRQKARYTAAEIWQQPDLWQALGKMLTACRAEWQTFLTPILAKPGLRVILAGAGSSAFVGRALAPWLREKTHLDAIAWGTTDIVANPRQYLDAARPTLLVSFARSGDSPESISAVKFADQIIPDCHHLIVACNAQSQLARYAQHNDNALLMTMPEGSHDKSFAMTSSFSCMLLAGALMLGGGVLPGWDGELARMITRSRTLLNVLQTPVKEIAAGGFTRYITLGSGPLAGIAEEAALKMLELTAGKIATRFDTTLGLRHGPKFMIDHQTLVVMMFSADDYSHQYDQDLWHELQRNGRARHIIGIGREKKAPPGALMLHDSHETLWLMFPYLLFLQMLAFESSLHHQLSPDNPSPNGEVNRVVKGVTIYSFNSSDAGSA